MMTIVSRGHSKTCICCVKRWVGLPDVDIVKRLAEYDKEAGRQRLADLVSSGYRMVK